jgi:catechol 2,3-dioxygenase-like lactoylglutathione lyase family enzyme
MKLGYVIKFVADTKRAVKFYRDLPGLPLKVRVSRLERICHR